MSVSVIIPAAGESTRMGGDTHKPFIELAGEPILLRTCKAIKSMPDVEEIIVAVHPDDLEEAQGTMWNKLSSAGVSMVVAGGESRAESVWNCVSVSDPAADLVAVHDSVRPFISADWCSLLFETALNRGAAIPVLPVSDTVKRTEKDVVIETVRRLGLMRVQTPQAFRRDLFVDAYEYALSTGGLNDNITDDASIIEAYGKEVAVVLGHPCNMKITTKHDLKIAEAFVAAGIV